MKKILVVIPTLTGGGAERTVANISLGLPDSIQADILMNSISDRDYPHSGNVISLGMRPDIPKTLVYQLRAFLLRCRKLRSLKKTGKYDSCLSFMEASNLANIITGKKYCKTIISVRTNLSVVSSKIFRYILNPFAKMLYRKADMVVALSKGVENDLVSHFHVTEEKTRTIYNGYGTESICELASKDPTSIEMEEGKFYFLTVGRNLHSKGQWHLVRAFAEIARKNPNTRLVILGDGELHTYIQDLACELGIADKVLLPGFVRDVYAVMSRCDVFVFPSLYEGFGGVMIESMICGLPVIASDYRYGVRELLAPDTDLAYEQKENVEQAKYGMIVPVCTGRKYCAQDPLENQETSLAKAMTLLMEDKSLYEHYAAMSRKRSDDFRMQEIIKQWVEII